jgi:hypothetical protein
MSLELDGVEVPRSLRVAVGIFLVYGLAVVVNAVIWQSLSGWQEASDFPPAIVRFLGVGLISWGLLKRERWAWWLGVVLPSFWILSAGLGVVAYWALVGDEADLVIPLPAAIFPLASFVSLGVAVGLLLKRDVRMAFRKNGG